MVSGSRSLVKSITFFINSESSSIISSINCISCQINNFFYRLYIFIFCQIDNFFYKLRFNIFKYNICYFIINLFNSFFIFKIIKIDICYFIFNLYKGFLSLKSSKTFLIVFQMFVFCLLLLFFVFSLLIIFFSILRFTLSLEGVFLTNLIVDCISVCYIF